MSPKLIALDADIEYDCYSTVRKWLTVRLMDDFFTRHLDVAPKGRNSIYMATLNCTVAK